MEQCAAVALFIQCAQGLKPDFQLNPEMMQRIHADYYLAFAETAEAQLTSTAQSDWLDRLERDHANLRAAISWYLEAGEALPAVRLVGAPKRRPHSPSRLNIACGAAIICPRFLHHAGIRGASPAVAAVEQATRRQLG